MTHLIWSWYWYMLFMIFDDGVAARCISSVADATRSAAATESLLRRSCADQLRCAHSASRVRDWDIAHFDGRAVRGAPGVCARYLTYRCEHFLGITEWSQDAFGRDWSTRIKHSCDCMHRWATPSPCNLRHDLFGWSSFVCASGLSGNSCAACNIWGAVASNSWVLRARTLRRRGPVHLQR